LSSALLLCAWLALPRPVSADAFSDKLSSVRRDLHAHPELANRETRTMGAIAAYLKAAGITDVRTGVAKTGVVATIHGAGKAAAVALRAPIDAFPVDEKPGRPYGSTTPKVSHACGHDALTAMLLGAAELLNAERDKLPGDVRLVFQPAEEGAPEGEEGGAPLMMKEKAFDGVATVFALHVDETLPVGQAGLAPFAVYAGADTLKIVVNGKAAHGATPWKGSDAIAVAAQVVTALQQLPSRQMDISDPIVLTLGTIQGGTRPNGVAAQVTMTGTLRTYSPAARKRMLERTAKLAKGVAESLGAQADVSWSDGIPPVVNAAGMADEYRPVLEKELGASNVKTMAAMPFADDFSVVSESIPSLYFQLGIRNEAKGITAGTHTPDFDVDEASIPLGAKLLAKLAERRLQQ
jgi:amidohydrolase